MNGPFKWLGWLLGLALLAGLPVVALAQEGGGETIEERITTLLEASALLEEGAGLHRSAANPQAAADAIAPLARIPQIDPELVLPDGSMHRTPDLALALDEVQQAATLSVGPVAAIESIPGVQRALRAELLQLGAFLPTDSPMRDDIARALDPAADSAAGFFRSIGALNFPVSPAESRLLGEIIEDYPSSFRAAEGGWWRMEHEELLALQPVFRRLIGGVNEALEAHPEFTALYGDQLVQDDPAGAPLPTAGGGSDYYSNYLARLIAVESLVREESLVLGRFSRGTVAVTPYGPVTEDLKDRVRGVTTEGQFREPLQIPADLQVVDADAFGQWLANLLSRFSPGNFPSFPTSIGEAWQWIAWIAVAALLIGVIVFIVTRMSFVSRDRARLATEADAVVSGRRLQMEAQFSKALEAARAGRLLEAWHWLLQGFIVGLAHRKLVLLDWSKTNREYARELQGGSASVYAIARRFFGAADRVLYGNHPTSLEEVQAFHDELLGTLRGGVGVG